MSQPHTYYQYDPMKDADKRFIGFTAAAAGVSAGVLTAGSAAATAVGVGLTAATVGGIGYAASQMFKKPETPSLPALPEAPSTAAAEEKAKADIETRRRAISRNKSIYTGPLGLTPVEKQSALNLKTLLGE